MSHEQPLWRYAGSGRVLPVGDRAWPPPPVLAEWLLESSGVDLSDHAAGGLVAVAVTAATLRTHH